MFQPIRRAVALVVLVLPVALTACTTGAAPSPAVPPASIEPGATCATLPAPSELPTDWRSTSTEASVIPIIVSSEQACGPDRFVFSFIDAASNEPIASPERSARVAFFNLGADPATPVATAEATFVWGIEGSRGVYIVPVAYPEAGEWGVELTTAAPGGPEESVRVRYQVRADRSAVGVGEPAVPVRTPTVADVGGDVAQISSDPEPNLAFYERSVDAAIEAGEPFMLAFATPAFCTSAQCGPTLDIVKAVAVRNPGLQVVNVEPYLLEHVDGKLQPVLDGNGQLQPAAATSAWGILSEPWVYVVGADGVVAGSFEGIVSEAELQAAIDAAS